MRKDVKHCFLGAEPDEGNRLISSSIICVQNLQDVIFIPGWVEGARFVRCVVSRNRKREVKINEYLHM